MAGGARSWGGALALLLMLSSYMPAGVLGPLPALGARASHEARKCCCDKYGHSKQGKHGTVCRMSRCSLREAPQPAGAPARRADFQPQAPLEAIAAALRGPVVPPPGGRFPPEVRQGPRTAFFPEPTTPPPRTFFAL